MDTAALYEVKQLKEYARGKIGEGFTRDELKPMIILKLTRSSLIASGSGLSTEEVADMVMDNL